MSFPLQRLRRLRQNPVLRRLVRETRLSIADLILPLFVQEGCTEKTEILSMPGQYRLSLSDLLKEATEAQLLGIPAVVLFGIPETKDEIGSSGFDDKGIVQQAIRAIKKECPELLVITDVCIDEYTSHGHCGLIQDGKILNDETLEVLVKMALSHANAGADIIAPSDMMDGRVAAIRKGLDTGGYSDTPIMSYAVKYASCFYGPFREAADSTPQFGDRKSYQMDPANRREAMQEAISDIQECADIIMVKPAMPYLDILREIRDQVEHPLAAYQVSGEYAMIKAASQKGWIDEDRAILESLLSIKRAGADMMLTYFAKDAAQLLKEGELP